MVIEPVMTTLLLALPDLADTVVGKFPCLARTQDWLSTAPHSVTGDPFQILQGCALLSMTHALLTQEWLGIKPDAMLGVSSGETNTMFASGAWHDMAWYAMTEDEWTAREPSRA